MTTHSGTPNSGGLTTEQRAELLHLLSAICDEQSSDEQRARLESIVLGHDDARTVYVQYIHMHAAVVRCNLAAEPDEPRDSDLVDAIRDRSTGSALQRPSALRPLDSAAPGAQKRPPAGPNRRCWDSWRQASAVCSSCPILSRYSRCFGGSCWPRCRGPSWRSGLLRGGGRTRRTWRSNGAPLRPWGG